MPTVGSFHGQYWKARANGVVAAGPATNAVYPKWQNAVHRSVGLCMTFGWIPLDVIRPWLSQLRWYWQLARRLWQWRSTTNHALLLAWIARLEEATPEQLELVERAFGVTGERKAVMQRVFAAMAMPEWEQARVGVRLCATSPKFHQPEQWLAYSRALKANAGQAQNVFRHVKVVHELRAAHPELSNPDAHLLTELAYQGLASVGREGRQIVEHEKTLVAR